MAEHECTCRNCGGRDHCKIKFEPSRKCCCFWKPELKPIWNPCSERLPENDAKCLVYTSDKRICMARWYGKYDEQGAWYIISDDVPKLYRIKNVPFWMPLPEPPEKEDADDT